MQKPSVNTAGGSPAPRPCRAAPVLAQVTDAGRDVGGDPAPRRRRDVGHVLEALAAVVVGRRPPEPVDRQRIDPVLREPQRQLLVERVQAADVREQQDGRAVRLRGPGEERRGLVAVGGDDGRPGAVEGAAGDGLDRRVAVEIEAHRT